MGQFVYSSNGRPRERVCQHSAGFETETASTLVMDLQDSWRGVYPEPEMELEVGVTRGDRHIDHILLPPCVSEHVQSAFTTPVGQADHQAAVVRLTPIADRKPSNLWKFPAYLLGQEPCQEGMHGLFSEWHHL